jgi:hypothetical protein
MKPMTRILIFPSFCCILAVAALFIMAALTPQDEKITLEAEPLYVNEFGDTIYKNECLYGLQVNRGGHGDITYLLKPNSQFITCKEETK